jgi:hypothetical protein
MFLRKNRNEEMFLKFLFKILVNLLRKFRFMLHKFINI